MYKKNLVRTHDEVRLDTHRHGGFEKKYYDAHRRQEWTWKISVTSAANDNRS